MGNARYLLLRKDLAAFASAKTPADMAGASHSLRVLVDTMQVWDAPKMQLVIVGNFPALRIPAIETVYDAMLESF